ncbi:MAG: molybdate ABC transporter substrate-binding protein [Nitrolancea sp.]
MTRTAGRPTEDDTCRIHGGGLLSLLAVILLLAACGGSSRTSTTATDGSSAQTATTANSAATPTGDASLISTNGNAPAISGDVTVFAAASLTEAFNEMKSNIESANSGTKIIMNFAGSSALRTQITQGAQADVFASADQKNMDPVVQAGDIDGATSTFAENRLVVLLPANNPGNIKTLKDLANSGLKIVLAQEQVPVGNYARQVLDKLSADPAYGSDFKDKVLANLASNELNVKDVVAKVQLGEADAGIVYKTDAPSADQSKVTTIDIPDQYNIVAQYPVGVVKGGSNADGARAFIQYLLSPAGQAVLNKYGFISPASK